HFVTFGWALFRAPDFVTALRLVDHLRGLFALSGWHLDQAYLFKTYGFTAMILYGLATLAFQSERISKAFRERLDVRVPTYSLALYLIIVLAPVHTDPFIYFQF
ncbi:MAG TPA: hypothetical protein VIU63_08575, partial [Nitrospira sp.]